jgi:hypothetical protein
MRLESVIFEKHKHLLNGDLHQDKGTIYAMGRKRHTIWSTCSPRSEGSAYNILQAHPLCMLAWLGNIAYVHWRTSEPKKLPDWMNVKAVILHCLQHHLRMFYQPEHFAKARSCFEMSLEDVDSHGTRYLWPGLLYQYATIEHPYNSPMSLRTTGKLVALFLRKAGNVGLHTTRVSRRLDNKVCTLIIGVNGDVRLEEVNFRSQSLYPYTPGKRIRLDSIEMFMSLEEFIETCKFENEAEILELIRDARTNCSQDCDQITTDQEENGSKISGDPRSEELDRSCSSTRTEPSIEDQTREPFHHKLDTAESRQLSITTSVSHKGETTELSNDIKLSSLRSGLLGRTSIVVSLIGKFSSIRAKWRAIPDLNNSFVSQSS